MINDDKFIKRINRELRWYEEGKIKLSKEKFEMMKAAKETIERIRKGNKEYEN